MVERYVYLEGPLRAVRYIDKKGAQMRMFGQGPNGWNLCSKHREECSFEAMDEVIWRHVSVDKDATYGDFEAVGIPRSWVKGILRGMLDGYEKQQ